MTVIACSMMKNEIELAMRRTGYQGAVIWLESGLHSDPHRLRAACQREIDRLDPEETCLLLYGQCGNGTVGLRCSCRTLCIPKFADCIRISLSLRPGMWDGADVRTIYSCGGWSDSERSIRADHDFSLKKYGEKRTKRLFSKMLHAYRDYCMMDTGAYCLEDYEAQSRETAALLGLTYGTCPAGTRIYEKILRGEIDEEFVVKTRGESVATEDFFW